MPRKPRLVFLTLLCYNVGIENALQCSTIQCDDWAAATGLTKLAPYHRAVRVHPAAGEWAAFGLAWDRGSPTQEDKKEVMREQSTRRAQEGRAAAKSVIASVSEAIPNCESRIAMAVKKACNSPA
jgi:hypothetical protein